MCVKGTDESNMILFEWAHPQASTADPGSCDRPTSVNRIERISESAGESRTWMRQPLIDRAWSGRYQSPGSGESTWTGWQLLWRPVGS